MKPSLQVLTEVYSRKVLVKEATVPTEIKFGKYYIIKPGIIDPTLAVLKSEPYSNAVPGVHSSTQKNLNELVGHGATFSKIVVIWPQGKGGGKYTLGYGKDNKKEDFLFVRSPAASATAPMIYFKDRKFNMYVFINDLMSVTNPVTIEQILKNVVRRGSYVINDDGTVDVLNNAEVYFGAKLEIDARRSIMIDDIPVKFRLIGGNFNIKDSFINYSKERLPDTVVNTLNLPVPKGYTDLSFLSNTTAAEIAVNARYSGTKSFSSCKGLNPTFKGKLTIEGGSFTGSKKNISLIGLPSELKELVLYRVESRDLTGCPNKIRILDISYCSFTTLIGISENIEVLMLGTLSEMPSFRGLSSSTIKALILPNHDHLSFTFDDFPKEVDLVCISNFPGASFTKYTSFNRELYDRVPFKEKYDFFMDVITVPNLRKIKKGFVFGPAYDLRNDPKELSRKVPDVTIEEALEVVQKYLDAMYKDGLDVPIDI